MSPTWYLRSLRSVAGCAPLSGRSAPRVWPICTPLSVYSAEPGMITPLEIEALGTQTRFWMV